ncbi:site-specific integrase [Aquabacterium soli]|uniref:Site-specific integrase n=2 Tax=Aquabacterium soli TaxID=2493092 RepID=A0A3R8YJT5_9BURK|nr:site-specific integrase [Aquabacterium soli]
MAAAHQEDHLWTERSLGQQLFDDQQSTTKYQRLKARAEARKIVSSETCHVPMFASFIQFQLMTAARRSETLKLKWNQVDLDRQTAFLPETKNGRPRTLPLRADLVALLRELPQTGEYVFPIPVDYLRKAWLRMCEASGIETLGSERLRIHDLRHEAISRVAEAGSQTPGGFSLLDLQAFSGHRDPRMLLRYTHLTPTGLATRLDAAFSECGLKYGKAVIYRGRTRLTEKAELPMSELMSAPITIAIEGNSNQKVVDLRAYRKAAA